MKTLLILLFLLNLFNLSFEAIELPLFESAYFSVTDKKEAQIYLNTSIYMVGQNIDISIKFASKKRYDNFHCNLIFYDSLDFSKVATEYCSEMSSKYNFATQIYSYTVYYNFKKPNKNRYLLFEFNKSHLTGGATIYHLNRPNSTSIELSPYSSLIVNSSTYVYQNNTYYGEKNIYFSFNFQNENKTLNQFEIYYGLDDYRDDKTFKHLNKQILVNPRLKENNYSFYFNFELSNNKPYICLIPGKINNQKYKINITQLLKLPRKLNIDRHMVVNSDDFVYFNISKYTLGSELFVKIMLTQTNRNSLTLYYKYNDENFYEDYVNMASIPQYSIYYKQIDDNKKNTSFIYNFKIEKNTNFILFQIPEVNNTNFIFHQIMDDESQRIQKEKKMKMILFIIPSIVMLATFILIIILIIKAIKNKKMINENNLNNLNDNKESSITYEKDDNSSYQRDNNYDIPSAPLPYYTQNYKRIN